MNFDEVDLVISKLSINIPDIKIISYKNYKSDMIKKNNCYLIGSDEIIYGEYDNPELLLISIFHELGHLCITLKEKEICRYHTFPIELKSWEKGLEIAYKYNIEFSDDAIKWGYEQAFTYCNHDLREKNR